MTEEQPHRLSDHEDLDDKVGHIAEEVVEEIEGTMESVLPTHLRLRAWARRRPVTHAIWRASVLLVGAFVVIAGIFTSIPGVPGPGLALIFFGIVILSSEFAWAHRARQPLQRWVDKFTDWFRRLRNRS